MVVSLNSRLESNKEEEEYLLTPTRPLSWIKSPFSGPWFVLALTGIRQMMIPIKAVDKLDLPPL